jgi:putative phosphoesterase
MGGVIQVGVISDTHGLLRPAAVRALQAVDLIIHAGDVGDPSVLEGLGAIAPLHAVRGNVDRGPWASGLPDTLTVEAGDCRLYVLHQLGQLEIDPAGAGFKAVIYGHTHRPHVERKGGVVYLNPGAAGRRRFALPVSMARLLVQSDQIDVELIQLEE